MVLADTNGNNRELMSSVRSKRG